jgi:hypothetical protein
MTQVNQPAGWRHIPSPRRRFCCRGEGQDEGLAGADRFIRRQAADAWFCRNGLWANSALVTLTPSLSLLRALRLQGEGSDSFSLAAFFAAGEMGL